MVLSAVLLSWVVFGSWMLFRPDAGVSGFDPIVGHVVVFFFVSVAAIGLLLRPLGRVRGLVVGALTAAAVGAVSEVLQPVLTATRQAQLSDFGGNLLGISGAVVASGVLAVALKKRSRREAVTAVLCIIGLVGSLAVMVIGGDRIHVALDCRGRGYEPVAEAEGGPVIRVDGESVWLGDADPIPLGDGLVLDDSTDLRCSVLRAGSYSIVATVVPDSIESNGPTRIFTSSISTELDMYNTHIGQDFDELSIRIRSGDDHQWESVPGVFEAGQRVTVAVVVADGQAEAFVDGASVATFDLVGDSFAEWDASYPILIGDEFTRNRTFEGTIESVSFFDRALTSDDSELAGQLSGAGD